MSDALPLVGIMTSYARIKDTMALRAGLLMAGCAAELARAHRYPYVVYLPDRVRVLPSEAELAATFAQIAQALTAAGARKLEARVTAIGLPRGGRCRVWVDWVMTHADKTRRTVAQTVEYVCDTSEGLRGEMTECLSLAKAA
jgi:hypothetical protein